MAELMRLIGSNESGHHKRVNSACILCCHHAHISWDYEAGHCETLHLFRASSMQFYCGTQWGSQCSNPVRGLSHTMAWIITPAACAASNVRRLELVDAHRGTLPTQPQAFKRSQPTLSVCLFANQPATSFVTTVRSRGKNIPWVCQVTFYPNFIRGGCER